jgi:hypothetical protein
MEGWMDGGWEYLYGEAVGYGMGDMRGAGFFYFLVPGSGVLY